MAKQANGELGGFVGKLGSVVGYRWKNVWCVRSQAAHVNNPRSAAQQQHRSLFKYEVQLAGRMRWAVNIGLKELSDEMGMTAINLFVKANKQAFSLVDGEVAVDYSQLCISAGAVAPVELTAVERDGHGVLTVGFDENPLHMPAGAHDSVHVWVWSPGDGFGYLATPVYRHMQQTAIVLPKMMTGSVLHLYAFAQDDKGRCSNTAYFCFNS